MTISGEPGATTISHYAQSCMFADGTFAPAGPVDFCNSTVEPFSRPDVAAAYLLGGELALRMISLAEAERG